MKLVILSWVLTHTRMKEKFTLKLKNRGTIQIRYPKTFQCKNNHKNEAGLHNMTMFQAGSSQQISGRSDGQAEPAQAVEPSEQMEVDQPLSPPEVNVYHGKSFV